MAKQRDRAILIWVLYLCEVVRHQWWQGESNIRINGRNTINGEKNDSDFWWSNVLEINVFSNKLFFIHPQRAWIPMCMATPISPSFIPTTFNLSYHHAYYHQFVSRHHAHQSPIIIGYFKSHRNFKFGILFPLVLVEKSKRAIWGHVSILDWRNSKDFSGQPSKLNFVLGQLYSRKFIRIVKIKVYQKTKNEINK